MKTLKNICLQFQIEYPILDIIVLTSGHINDTYKVICKNNTSYVLQRINHSVFKNVPEIISNKVEITNQLKSTAHNYQIANFIPSKANTYYIETKGGFWTMMTYISNSRTIERAENTKQVFEAGKLYGNFLATTFTIEVEKIVETLPNFHAVPFRFLQFEKALKLADTSRISACQNLIDYIFGLKTDLFQLSELKEKNAFPIRITHNDTKLSNILFDKNDNGLSVIDLDTVMPGIVHFDFGDSIRSICSNTVEDSTDLEQTIINLKFYEAYCKGYASKTSKILTLKEIEFLPLSVKTLIYIMGLRFLTDYLNNDIYFKTTHKTHNLNRAKNQMALLKNVIKNFEEIKQITYNSFNLENIS